MSEPFVFTWTETKTHEKKLADADGKPITRGSILRHEDGRSRGVVAWIGYPDRPDVAAHAPPLARVGDIEVKETAGTSRVSNQYSKWRHIPREETTYWERLTSWFYRPFEYDEPEPDVEECNRISRDEALAVDGIMALLPADPVNWEYGPWPDRIEDALRFLVAHLQKLSGEKET